MKQKPTKKELEELYLDKKLSLQQIADIYLCSETTIFRRMNKYKIKRRTISDANKLKLKKPYKKQIKIKCQQCKEVFEVTPARKNIAKYCSQECAGKWRSENIIREKHWSWKRKIEIKCRQCSKKFKTTSYYYKIKKFCSRKCKDKWHGKKYSGKNSPTYIDGRSPLRDLIRVSIEYKQWRNKVFQRDNYTCQDCGDNKGGYLEAHHKKQFAEILSEFLNFYSQFSPIEDKETLVRLSWSWKDFWEMDNGITVCKECHKKTKNYFKNIKKS